MNKTEITVLGCGSSLGVPRIDGYWGKADKKNPKNYRTRCSLFIRYRSMNIIIDTSPDIKSQILKNKIKYLIPGGEKPLVLLSNSEKELKKNNILLIGNNFELTQKLSDKLITFKILEKNGFEIPLTKEITSINDITKLKFPCIVKPAVDSGGSDSVFIANNIDDCNLYYNILKINGKKIITQEYISLNEGEFTIGVLSLPDGKVVACTIMERIFNSKLSISQNNKLGLISSGYSQGLIKEFPELEKQARLIAMTIKSTGPINIQARVRNGVLIPFEINPRFSASTYLRALAGINEIDFLLRFFIKGENEFIYKLKPGYYLRSFTETYVPETI